MKIMVAYDGTLQAKDALVYGMEKAREKGGEVVAFHVFNSPLFIDYDATLARLNRINKMLAEARIETKKIMRSGYPDEEIMKAADEFSVSLVILPSGGSTPSELRKAAAVILNEPNRPKSPFLLVPATKTA